jgi:hypothetical protein
MSFEGAWGFDPDASLRAQSAFRLGMGGSDGPVEETSAGLNDDNFRGEARIPESREAQIYELQRMFRL